MSTAGSQVALHQVTTVGSVTTLTYAQPPAASSTVDGVPPAVPLLAAGCSDGSVHLLSHGVTHSAVSHARSLTSNEDSPAGAPTAAAAAGQRVGGGNRRTHSDGGCPSVSSAQRSVEKLCVALVADLRAVTALHLAWAPSRAVGECWPQLRESTRRDLTDTRRTKSSLEIRTEGYVGSESIGKTF